MASYLEKIIKGLICLTFFVPLVLVPASFIFPFIVPKILVFRSLALLMLGAYLLLLQANWQKYKITFSWIDCAALLFFSSFAVSTFAGIDWYKSFWDNHERMLGLFTIFHFVAYYFIVSKAIGEWKEWRVLLRVFLFAGLLVMFIGMIQKANPDFMLNRGSDRVSATLGNAIYYSGYGLFLMFISILLFLKEENKFWKYFALVSGIFGFLGIFWGGTKGTFLGLITGGIILLFTYLFTTREQRKLKYIAWSLLFLMIVVLGLLFNFRKTNFVQNIPGVGGLMNISFSEGTASTRLMAWGIALDAWKERPVFGWGPNNYYYAFNKYYAPEFLEHGWGETWFDNAHSAVMNTLAVQGLTGILAYFLLFIVPAIVLLKSFLAGRTDKHVLAVGLAFLAGHFVHNSTVFENPTSYLYFFFFLAFINSQTTSYKLQATSYKKEREISLGLSAVVFLVILILIYSTNINPARANMSALNTLRAVYSNPIAGIEVYKKTMAIPSPHIDDIRNDFARVVNEITSAMINSKMDNSKIKEILNIALQECQKNRELHPLDIRVHLQQSQLNSLSALVSNEAKYLWEAEKNLEEALNLSPKRQQLQYMLAMVKLQLNKPQEAVRLLEDSIANDDKIGEGWARLIYVYSQIGQKEKAVALLEEAEKKNIAFDERLQGIIGMALPDN